MSDPPTCPLWMMSFGDCMSLLVTFFVMLIAFTETEDANLMETLNAMKGALGIVSSPVAVSADAMKFDSIGLIKGKSKRVKWLTVDQLSQVMPDAELAVDRFGRPQVGGAKKMVSVMMLEEGLAFVVHAESVFKKGTVEFDGNGYSDLWDQIGGFVGRLDNEIRVVCTLPPNAEVLSPRVKTVVGLCIERAAIVESAIVASGGIVGERLSIGGKVVEAVGGELPASRLEIIILGKRVLRAISPEEIIVRGQWK
jgi:chemotaxis protein MotB